MQILLDSPEPRQRLHDQAITVAGSIVADELPGVVRVWCGDRLIGETCVLSQLGDRYHFQMLGRLATPGGTESLATLVITVDEQATAEVPVVLVPTRLHERAYGEVLFPGRAEVLHRENIYGSGPPIETPSGELVDLLLKCLPPRSSVLDVGCGAGAYGPPLIAAGHEWLGVEVDPTCTEILSRRALPFRELQPGETRLPFNDRQFDAAIATEVLEHIDDLANFIADLSRITRARFLASVPNMEVIPYFAPLGVVPWHLLEATHVNFFTRASLRAALQRNFRHVEVFSYAEHPVRTAEGIPVHLHLFAVAEK